MKPFSLLVKPAGADCNLECAYCFYLGKSALYSRAAPHRMSDAVLDRMIASYMATPQPQYAFCWQGGEPTLMGIEFFRRVTGLQQRHGRSGALAANGLQTNATLVNDALAAHFAQYKFLLGVSLDGPAEIHDRFRRTGNGRGSHAAVLRGIACLQRHRVEFNILTLVTAANAGRAVEVYRYLCDQGFLYHQYIPCVEFDDRGAPAPFAISGKAWGDFLCALFDEWRRRDMRRVSIRLFDSILARIVDSRCDICHMDRNCCQYFVVEHNGDIYPCDFYVQPALRLGNVMETPWATAQESPLYLEFGRRKAAWNSVCAQCEFLALCAGDCLKHRRPLRQDSSVPSEICAGWRKFYRHALPRLKTIAASIQAERKEHRQRP